MSEGAYATDDLLQRTKALSSRDAGLASQIVFGCLRYQGQLDFLIAKYSGRRAADLNLPVLIALRAAIFQMRYLDRIPAHAAVDDSVEYVKQEKRAATGLANAVLRKVNRNAVEFQDEATSLSCPGWLLERWAKHFGPDAARRIAGAALQQPATYVRVPAGMQAATSAEFEATSVAGCFRITPEIARRTPEGEGAEAKRSHLNKRSAPEVANIAKRTPLAKRSAADEPEITIRTGNGQFRMQDIGSQAIIPLLDLQRGQSYLDVCAAPGNKTLQALETELGFAVACDISEGRIRTIPAVCSRVVLDGTKRLPFAREFDRIFIDAPCSGTGTLARNPEIKWRVQAEDFERFQKKQVLLLERAAERLAAQGKLLYATCSLEVEENEGVISSFLAKRSGYRVESTYRRVPGRDEGDGFYAALLVREGSD